MHSSTTRGDSIGNPQELCIVVSAWISWVSVCSISMPPTREDLRVVLAFNHSPSLPPHTHEHMTTHANTPKNYTAKCLLWMWSPSSTNQARITCTSSAHQAHTKRTSSAQQAQTYGRWEVVAVPCRAPWERRQFWKGARGPARQCCAGRKSRGGPSAFVSLSKALGLRASDFR